MNNKKRNYKRFKNYKYKNHHHHGFKPFVGKFITAPEETPLINPPTLTVPNNKFKPVSHPKPFIDKKKIKQIPPFEKIDYLQYQKLPITQTNTNSQDATYFFAAGGLDEVGKNSYVIEHNEEVIMIDYGIKFANSQLLGFSGIVPNLKYFLDNNITINALFITHGHEDHMGGIPYLVQNLQVKKIYLPLFGSELVKKKLEEIKTIKYPPQLVVYDGATVVNTKYFEIRFFKVCHSIPDAYGCFVKTPNGNFVTAGDYRYDFGKETDDTNVHKLVEFSQQGVDVFFSESTNSEQPGFSQSEDKIINNVDGLIKNAIGRVFVSTFASNIGRIQKIIERALQYNRKICFIGRSIEKNLKLSKKIGYLQLRDDDIVNVKSLGLYKDHEVFIVLTGSQGEEKGALNLLAEGKYQHFKLKPTDTIIMSSNPIPGNYKNVENLVNKLYKYGVKLHQNSKELSIHSSGHATKQEQQMMVKVINPKYVMPIHGETKMLRAMKQNCVELGYDPNMIIILTNGLKAKLVDHEVTITNTLVDASPVYIDQKMAAANVDKLLNQRRNLSKNGIFNVVVNINLANKVVHRTPMISTRGCFYAKDSHALISKIAYSIKDELNSLLTNATYLKSKAVQAIERIVNFYVWKNKKKNPVVLTTIFEEE